MTPTLGSTWNHRLSRITDNDKWYHLKWQQQVAVILFQLTTMGDSCITSIDNHKIQWYHVVTVVTLARNLLPNYVFVQVPYCYLQLPKGNSPRSLSLCPACSWWEICMQSKCYEHGMQMRLAQPTSILPPADMISLQNWECRVVCSTILAGDKRNYWTGSVFTRIWSFLFRDNYII